MPVKTAESAVDPEAARQRKREAMTHSASREAIWREVNLDPLIRIR
jgi:hypothetical protein